MGVTQYKNVAGSHTIEHLKHWYHTWALLSKVYNFAVAQGPQKLATKVEM